MFNASQVQIVETERAANDYQNLVHVYAVQGKLASYYTGNVVNSETVVACAKR